MAETPNHPAAQASPKSGPKSGPTPATAIWLVAGVLLAATVLRVLSAMGDLWIDEVWSLDTIAIAGTLPPTLANAANWVALFFHANTHALNTLYMTALGPDAGAFAYRALSVVSGITTVALAAVVGWRRSPLEGVIAAVMVAVSYPMVHYAGEARGYAPMLMAALAAFWVLERYLETPSPGKAWAFIAISMLGLAAHLTFLVVLGGLGMWAAAVLFQRSDSLIELLAKLTVLFGVQAIAISAYGAVAWSNQVFGGLPILTIADSVTVMADLTFGVEPFSRVPAAALAVALTVAGWLVRRQGDAAWVFFCLVVLVYPLAFILFEPTDDTTPRYFLTSALFALMVSARMVAALMTAGRGPAIAAGVLLALFVVANGMLLEKFFAVGRGGYGDAVRLITADSGGPAQSPAQSPTKSPTKNQIRVAGYQQFSVGKVLRHQARVLGLADMIRFVDIKDDARDPARWFIDGHLFVGRRPGDQSPAGWFVNGSFGHRPPAPPTLHRQGPAGPVAYRLKAVFPHWGLSGDTWAVYRRGQ